MKHRGSLIVGLLALCALIAILLSGLTTYRKGWLAVSNLDLNINALMSVAVTGAVLIGQFPEAAMVMVLFNVSEAIEAKALDRARNAIKDLLALAPDTATVLREDGSWQEADIRTVAVGSRVRVRPGEKIALDGLVLAGRKDDIRAMFISLSCKGAIKAGQRLADDEAAALLRQWLHTPEREYCPHGRPSILRWDAVALEKLFKRRQ